MAIGISKHIIARVGYCTCGGEVDCLYDQEAQGWYCMCQKCYETGPTKDDPDDAIHCYPKPA